MLLYFGNHAQNMFIIRTFSNSIEQILSVIALYFFLH